MLDTRTLRGRLTLAYAAVLAVALVVFAIVTLVTIDSLQRNYLDQLLADSLLERTLPDKPNSRLQKYRLTEKGRAWLAARKMETCG